MSKPRYRYEGCSNGVMLWVATRPIDSRTEHITCSWDWFWGDDND